MLIGVYLWPSAEIQAHFHVGNVVEEVYRMTILIGVEISDSFDLITTALRVVAMVR